MYRFYLDLFFQWMEQRNRKPLVIRGARQVGKTYLVRKFAEQSFDQLIELNFDRDPDKVSLFAPSSVHEIIQLLEVDAGAKITPGKTLLFLDEIQAAPDVFPKLRYFYEEYPQLHVIAAGSLLDFMLSDHSFSMPVGRVDYLHLGPMSFEEFLIADDQQSLVEFMRRYDGSGAFPETFHHQFMGMLRKYFVIGGMPGAVSAYIDTKDFHEVAREQQSILQNYADDFPKYQRRADVHLLRKTFAKVPGLVGRKLKYTHIDPDHKAAQLSKALDLLELARVIYRVKHSSANGIPLASEANDRNFKTLFLDVGLVSTSLGLELTDFHPDYRIMLVNQGALAEQFVGQHLLYTGKPYEPPQLFYWNREKKNSSAEVDYILSVGSNIVPIEVKSGKTGTLKSLHIFVEEKQRKLGIRFNTHPPSILDTKTVTSKAQGRSFRLLSLPLYMVEQTKSWIQKQQQ